MRIKPDLSFVRTTVPAFLGLFIFILIIFISPLLDGSWDVWAKTIIHLLTVAACMAVLITFLSKEQPVSIPVRQFLIFPVFIAWISVAVISARVGFNARMELYNWITYILLFTGICVLGVHNIKLHSVIISAVITAGMLSLLGIYQFIMLQQIPQATMINANILAGYLVMILPLFWYLIEAKKTAVRTRTGYYIGAALCVFIILLTRSTAAIFSLLFAVLTIRHGRKGIITGCIIGVLFFLVKSWNSGIADRIQWWISALHMAYDHPLTGIGPANFELVYPQYRIEGLSTLFAHNYYLQLIAEVGIPGFLLYGIGVFLIMKHTGNKYLKMSLLACLVHNIFDYNLYIPAVSILFWSIGAVGVSAYFKDSPGRIMLVSLGKKSVTYITSVVLVLLAVYVYDVLVMHGAVKHLSKARYYAEQGDLQAAEAMYNRAVNLDSGLYHAYDSLSELHFNRYITSGNYSDIMDAIITLEEAARGNPNNAQYYFRIAYLYNLLGDSAMASQSLSHAIQYDPVHTEHYTAWKKEHIQ